MYTPFKQRLPFGSVFCDGSNISWNSPTIKMEHGSASEINQMLEILESNGITRIQQVQGHKTITSLDKMINHYFLEQTKNYMVLYWYEQWEEDGIPFSCPHKLTTNPADIVKDGTPLITGYKSFCKVSNDFKKLYHKSLKDVFIGKTPQMDTSIEIKQCVPRPVNFGLKCKKILDHFYMADVSGAYPFEGSKKLPTLKDHLILDGIHEPTKEYPFAFYIESHHIKIYDELDTHDFQSFNFWYNCDEMYIDVAPEEERTILCKESELGLSDMFHEYYVKRLKDDIYKQIVNLTIGFFQRNTQPIFSHISAVILARCAMRILRLARNIERLGNTVALIATDAVGWIGSSCEGLYVNEHDRRFGAFVIKYKNTQAVVMGPKKYQVAIENGVKTVWAGPKMEYTSQLAFGEIIDSKLVPYEITFDDETNRFRECFVDADTELVTLGDKV